jgi:predicted nucleotidyltransferase
MHERESIPPEVIRALLSFVDSVVPEGGESVWLTGSRVRGGFQPDSDWDVVAFSKYTSSAADLFKSNLTSQHKIQGGKIELVIAHPDDWNDPRPYMSELRKSGLRLR